MVDVCDDVRRLLVLCAIFGVEGKLDALERPSGDSDHRVKTAVVANIGRMQILTIGIWRGTLFDVPVADVLSTDEKSSPLVKIGSKIVPRTDVSRRRQGLRPDHDVVLPELANAGVVGRRIADQVSIVAVEQARESLLVVLDSVAPVAPRVSIDYEHSRDRRKLKVRGDDVARGDLHTHRFSATIAWTVGQSANRVGAYGYLQGVVPLWINCCLCRGAWQAHHCCHGLTINGTGHPTSDGATGAGNQREVDLSDGLGSDLDAVGCTVIVSELAGRDVVQTLSDGKRIVAVALGHRVGLPTRQVPHRDRGCLNGQAR